MGSRRRRGCLLLLLLLLWAVIGASGMRWRCRRLTAGMLVEAGIELALCRSAWLAYMQIHSSQ